MLFRGLQAWHDSTQNFVNDPAGYISQPFLAAVVKICQTLMIDTQQVQGGCMQIVNMDRVLDRSQSDGIRCSVCHPSANSGTAASNT